MATSEERMRILRMIQEGKISAAEGMQLLDALADASLTPPKKAGSDAPTLPGKGARWFRVRVTDTNSGKIRVNVRLPVNVLTSGFKLGARFSPQVEGLDTEQLMAAIRSGETGLIADVYDEKDGEHVEVFLE